MNLNSSREFLRYILPKVSRTFALNIKVLRGIEYDFVGTTYLICRFIDTIEDSPFLSSDEKILFLEEFVSIFSLPLPSLDQTSSLVDKILSPTGKISEIPFENELIRRFNEVVYLYNSFPEVYRSISKDMIVTMAGGMIDFIRKYSSKERKVLKDEKELEKYCYYVAGTVGIILTRLFLLKITLPQSRLILEKYTNDFGLALQMTNIVKDFSADKKRGWSYIPKTVLDQSGVSVDDYYGQMDSLQIKKIQDILIKKIEIFIENSLKYCLAIPAKQNRHRIFCLIPLFLAIKTVFFIKNSNYSQIKKRKIGKISLFTTIFIVYLISPFNFLIKKYYFILKK